jgi:hypothetical protein
VRCGNFTKLRVPVGREHFLLDTEVPRRLGNSISIRTIDFIQLIFEKYEQSGRTNRSDRVVAISGVVKRMESVIDTKCRYGVFEAFHPQLLLWRRRCPDATGGNETGYKYQHLPSCSWMAYSRICFLSINHKLEVPAAGDLRFDAKRERVLLVQGRAFQNCIMGWKGSGYTILDAGSKDVGVLWFDIAKHVHFQS